MKPLRPRHKPPMPNSDELLALLMDNVTEYALIILDPDGAVALWNAGAQRLLGYEEQEILGLHFAVFFTPEDIAAGRPERELQTAREDGRATDDNWLVRKDGSRLWASGMTMPLWDASSAYAALPKLSATALSASRPKPNAMTCSAASTPPLCRPRLLCACAMPCSRWPPTNSKTRSPRS